MGEEIIIKNIELITLESGAVYQIDIWFTQQNIGDRIFMPMIDLDVKINEAKRQYFISK